MLARGIGEKKAEGLVFQSFSRHDLDAKTA
jgi:hypothetical protein